MTPAFFLISPLWLATQLRVQELSWGELSYVGTLQLQLIVAMASTLVAMASTLCKNTCLGGRCKYVHIIPFQCEVPNRTKNPLTPSLKRPAHGANKADGDRGASYEICSV